MSEDVIINGVKYLPAEKVILNARQIKEALLSLYWGKCSDLSDEELKRRCDTVFVIIYDDASDYSPGTPTINEFVSNMTSKK